MPRLDDQIIALANRGGDTATVDFWHTTNPPKTLVVSAHGYQDPPAGDGKVLQALDLARAYPLRNYAFLIPWDRALHNEPLIRRTQRLGDYVRAFQTNGGKFASARPPGLYVGPYLYPIDGLPAALQAAFDSSECDIAYLSDTSDLSEPIPLDSLLRSPCPRGGGSFLDLYSDFLLLCCRTSTARRPIGLSRAPHAFPDGLYQIDLRPRLFAHPFRGMLSREI